ncbi:RNA polymerase III subunit C82 [Rhizina undulata]
MHSSIVRVQNVLGFFTTVAFVLGALVALSSFILQTGSPTVDVDVRNVKIVRRRAHQYYASKQQEYAFINFDLEADLEPLFNWNTKQVFAYLTASYPGKKYSENEVVIWDIIIPSKNAAKLHLKNERAKYNINDITGKFAEQNATLTFSWNIQPHVGALTWGSEGVSEAFTLPQVGAETKAKTATVGNKQKELCVLLVNGIYGEVSSKVVQVLLEAGRLPLHQIASRTKLSVKIVQQTLVVLVQQHLIVHYTHNEGGRETVFYECAWMQIYELVHSGRVIRTMEDRFGNDGALIISNMLQLGHARVSDFLSAYGISTKKSKFAQAPTANGNSSMSNDYDQESPISSVETLKSVMSEMLKERFLIPVQAHHMHPQTDTVNLIRAQLTAQLRKNFSTEIKLVKEVKRQMAIKLKNMADGDTSERAGMKRKAGGGGGREKKRQKVSIYDDVEDEAEWEIDESIVLRVNHEKFLVLFRNEELVSLAGKKLGKVTSQVYSEFLKRLEVRYLRCREPEEEDEDEEDEDPKKKIKLSVLELSKDFPTDINLENSIVSASVTASTISRKRSYDDDDKPRSNGHRKLNGNTFDHEDNEVEEVDEWGEMNGEDFDVDPASLEKKKRMELLKQHLELLAEDSYKFLSLESNRGMGEWSVNYKELGKTMRSIAMENVVEERFGQEGTRILRILKNKGKLDEKQIANIALLKQKETRATLTSLQESGHLELQEVPKTHPPAVAKTYFLWYHDPERARRILIGDIYKAMSRCIQRTNCEREKRASLLEKWERTDVQANQEEYLSPNEKRELSIWRSREERLLVQLFRLDRMIMILRDF